MIRIIAVRDAFGTRPGCTALIASALMPLQKIGNHDSINYTGEMI